MRADAAAPAAPVGAHARARARIHEHRREPLYIDTPCSGNLIDIPCCSGSTSTLRRALGRARFSFDLARCSTGAARLGIGRQQVRSHPASGLSQRAQVKASSLAPSIATESTLVARAGVYRSARLWARWNRAALSPRVVQLKLGCRARKRVVWSSGHKRLRIRCQGHCWPSGRSGAGWGRSQGLPWVGGGLGGALCGVRGGDLRAADSSAPTPPGLQVPEVRLGGVGC